MQKPDVVPTRRYSIDETRQLLGGIARSTLSQWTNRGYIKCSYHKVGMRKFYTGLEILRCWNLIA